MNRILAWLTHPPLDGRRSILLLRLMAGGVFFWEGILKFVYTNRVLDRKDNNLLKLHISP